MRLNRFDLNQIVCLEALIAERSVSRAAERVHLSQSAMSAVLAQLRGHFNDPLLVRSGRALVLTPFARGLAAPVSELMSRAHAFTALAPDRAPADIDREFKIVASDYNMAACLSDAVRRVADHMPNLRFDVLPLTSISPQSLATGEVDLLVAGQTLNVGQPPNETLYDDRFVCLTCADHAPDGGALTRAEFFARRQIVVRYFEYQLTFEDEEMIRREGMTRPRQIAVWSYSLVPRLIIGTPMVATVLSRVATQFAERWPVRVYPYPIDHDPVSIYAYWHASREGDPVLETFMNAARAVAAETSVMS
jgi:DNA-binding transcriptional LysR family regulator